MGCISITYHKINTEAKQVLAYLLSSRGWMVLSASLNRDDSLTKALLTDWSVRLQFLSLDPPSFVDHTDCDHMQN